MSDPIPNDRIDETDESFLDELYNEIPIGMDDTPDMEGTDDEIIGSYEEDQGFNWSDDKDNPDEGSFAD